MLVATSGGIDSSVLAHLVASSAKKLGIKMALAYIHHGLRNEADSELEFVKEAAQKLGAGFFFSHIRPAKGANLQSRARAMRYEALGKLADENGFDWIATAHNRDDQAETVLFRLLRGTATAGLSGIYPRSGRIVRPLLDWSREKIERYAKEHDVPFVVDKSNASGDYARNRLRQVALPVLNEVMEKDVRPNLARFARIALLEREALSELASIDLKQVGKTHSQGESLDIPLLGGLSAGRRLGVLRLAVLTAKGDLRQIESGHLLAMDRLLRSNNPSAEVRLPGNIFARRQYDRLVIEKAPIDPNEPAPIDILHPGTYLYGAIEVHLEWIPQGEPGLTPQESRAYIDVELTDFPFTIRGVRDGDRIVLAGRSGTRKLSDLFINEKIPRRIRPQIPLLCDAQGILWVPGIGVAQRVAPFDLTRRLLYLSLN